MRTMRYILSLITILSVVNVCAATYGTLYKTHERRPVYITQVGTPAPIIPMNTLDAPMMKSGSALPMAAVSGTKTANDYATASAPHRAKRDVGGGGTEDDEDPDLPVEPYPLGDAAIPLALLALGYMVYLTYKTSKSRKRVRA